MKSFLVIVLFVGLFGLAMGAGAYAAKEDKKDLDLLRQLMYALKARKALDEDTGMTLQRRNSYGIVWKGGSDRKLYIYLQKSTNCADPCQFEITFQDEDGKAVGNELDAEFKDTEGGRVEFTESEIMDNPFGKGQNNVGGSRGKLPDQLIVRVCRIEQTGLRACNKRQVDTRKDDDAVFLKTVKDN